MNAALHCSRGLRRAFFAAALLLAGLPAHSQSGTWFFNANSSWIDTNNWVGGTLPGNNNTGIANFVSGNPTVNQDSGGPWTLNSLVLNAGYTFTAAGEIVFDGAAPSIIGGGGGTTFNTPIGFAQPMTLNISSGTVTFNSITTNGSGITKAGAGTVVITPTNLVLGPVSIQGGTLTTSQTTVNPTRTLLMDVPGGNLNTGPGYWASVNGTVGNIALLGNTEIGNGGTFSGNVTGPAELYASAGTLTLLGNNSFLNGLRVGAANVTIGNGTTGTFPNGPITFNPGNGSVTLHPTAPATITSIAAQLFTTPAMQINGGTITGTGPWNLADGNFTVSGGTVVASSLATGGILTVAAGGSFSANLVAVGGLAGSGTITTGAALTLNSAAPSNFAGMLMGTGSLDKMGLGTLTLSGNSTYSGATTVAQSTLLVNGSITSNVLVGPTSTLGGTGSIAGSVQVNGSLSPGSAGPGVLATGSLQILGTLNVEINGPAAGTGYDRVNVTGTVGLGNTLVLSGTYVPVAGDQFILIDNDGADPVGGSFPGFFEGTTFTFNGRLMRITYVGGDGNDVAIVPVTFTATSSANAGGTIAPLGAQPVLSGGTTSFTITPNAGFTIQAVTGTCGGNLAGNVFTTNAVVANCTVVANFLINTYTVTSSAGANGTIAPLGATPVNHGATAIFTVTPAATYSASVGGTCGGNLVGNTFTTNPITGPCTVIASFSQITFTVTPSAGANGTISPNTAQTVTQNATATFTVTPNAGYTASVAGTCGGTLAGTTYTTDAITANCTIAATFSQNNYTVTPSAGANGSIAPIAPQTVGHGATTTFTVTPSAGFTASVAGTCGGALVGTTFTTAPITGNCTVAATFATSPVTTFTGPTATASGNATVSFTGGGLACSFAPQGSGAMQSAFFIPVQGHAKSPPAGTAPANTSFPHGLLDFVLVNCNQSAVVAFTITYPQVLPTGTQYWKYGPTPTSAAPVWYVLPATIAGNTVTFTITDGGLGDDDLTTNGTLVDQGGPGVPGAPGLGPVATPTLSEWALLVLALLMLGVGMNQLPGRRRAGR
jgi:autotransporter-associated beta strand protein